MRKTYQITVVRVEGEGDNQKTIEKTCTVTTSFAARTIIDQRLGGPLGFMLKIGESKGLFTITDAACFLWALISAAGHTDITEQDVGEWLNDIGEIETAAIMNPILEDWVGAVDQRKKPKAPAKPSGSARGKRTASS